MMTTNKSMKSNLNHRIQGYHKEIFNYILPFCNWNVETAEDAAQQTILKAILKIHQYKEQGSLKYWLFRIAKNITVDKNRQDNKLQIYLTDKINNFEAEETIDEPNLFDSKNIKLINQLIPKLTEPQQEVLQLYYFENLTFKEIATYKKESINTILGRIRYAKSNLKKMINIKLK